MTPKTDVETRYDAHTGVGPASAAGRTSSRATGGDRRRASVSWSHVLPLAVVLAFANGFWIIALRGAIGAIERTSAPFSAWWHESTLLVPVYVVAVLAAFLLAQRWFGPRPQGFRPVAGDHRDGGPGCYDGGDAAADRELLVRLPPAARPTCITWAPYTRVATRRARPPESRPR